MASTVLQPVAEQIGTIAAAIGLTPSIKKYVWAPTPQNLTKLPAAVVGLPDIARTGIEEAESQLGSDDWTLRYPVDLWFDLSEAIAAQTRAAEYVEAFIAAMDDDQGLSGTALEAKVIEARISYDQTDAKRPLLAYECVVEVLKLV